MSGRLGPRHWDFNPHVETCDVWPLLCFASLFAPASRSAAAISLCPTLLANIKIISPAFQGVPLNRRAVPRQTQQAFNGSADVTQRTIHEAIA